MRRGLERRFRSLIIPRSASISKWRVPTEPILMSAPVQVRRCEPSDEAALSLVGKATFLETFAGVIEGKDIVAHCEKAHSPRVYGKWLADARYELSLAEAAPGNAPVGYMVLGPADLPLNDLADSDSELKRIYILRRFQGSGLGKALLAEACGYANRVGARRLLLGVYSKNDSAIAFYRHIGFRQLGVRKFDVGNKQYDDIVMGMDIPNKGWE
jgi:ribosomal protein S18 acetylase RimI-like enzyme